MKKNHLTLFLSCLLAMGCAPSGQKEVMLIPQPQVCELHSGVYSFSAGEAFYTNLSGDERDDLAAVLASSPFRLVASDDSDILMCGRDCSVQFLFGVILSG